MTLRKVLSIVLGAAALLLLGFMVLGIVFPGTWSTARTLVIDAPPEFVYPYVEDLAAWDDWTSWGEIESTFDGPSQGVGARRTWDDPNLGEGSMEIVGADSPTLLAYAVSVEGGSLRFDGTITLEPSGAGTEVRWTESGDFGMNPLLGWVARRMDETQGRQLEFDLERLKETVEAQVPR